jgi:hypothetical protein
VDSFIGKNIRNSYLYEENGKIDIIPFDFNLSLGNKYSSWSPEEINSVELIEVRYKIHSKIVDTILENEEYHQKYKEYLKQTLNKLQQLYNQGLIDKLYKQVDETVRDGTEKVHAYEEFLQEKKVLEDFIINRMDTLEYDYLRTN